MESLTKLVIPINARIIFCTLSIGLFQQIIIYVMLHITNSIADSLKFFVRVILPPNTAIVLIISRILIHLLNPFIRNFP